MKENDKRVEYLCGFIINAIAIIIGIAGIYVTSTYIIDQNEIIDISNNGNQFNCTLDNYKLYTDEYKVYYTLNSTLGSNQWSQSHVTNINFNVTQCGDWIDCWALDIDSRAIVQQIDEIPDYGIYLYMNIACDILLFVSLITIAIITRKMIHTIKHASYVDIN